MGNEIDLTKYEVRTDLTIEAISEVKERTGITETSEQFEQLKITTVTVLPQAEAALRKKPGQYITIEFDDVTDHTNQASVTKALTKALKQLLEHLRIKKEATCLMIGLGNDKSTPDALGPLVINKILVTKHLFELGVASPGFRPVSAFAPGVMGQTGLETSTIIKGVVVEAAPDFVIVVDALAASSLTRINKTIQLTDTGIHPGSGVGNARAEISQEVLGVPVIAIGVPTVVEAVTIVSDTINYLTKKVAFNKAHLDQPIFKLIPPNNPDYLKAKDELSAREKQDLMGLLGTLNEGERRSLIAEVLTPIGYNLMVTPKEIDFLMKQLSDLLAKGINGALHRQIN